MVPPRRCALSRETLHKAAAGTEAPSQEHLLGTPVPKDTDPAWGDHPDQGLLADRGQYLCSHTYHSIFVSKTYNKPAVL